MRKALSIILLLLCSVNSSEISTHDIHPIVRNERTDDEVDIEGNISILKTEKLYLKDLQRIDSIAFPVILASIDDSLINSCSLSKHEIAMVIETISMFESSKRSKKGTMPFKSSLFIKSNNAFGIKGKGHRAYTAEYNNGEREVIYSSFKKYDHFADGINDLIKLLIKRYNLEDATTQEVVFRTMKRKGYFTAPIRYMYSLINTNKKINSYHDRNI